MAKVIDTVSGPMLTSPALAHSFTRGDMIVEREWMGSDVDRVLIIFGGEYTADGGYVLSGHDGVEPFELYTKPNTPHLMVIGGASRQG